MTSCPARVGYRSCLGPSGVLFVSLFNWKGAKNRLKPVVLILQLLISFSQRLIFLCQLFHQVQQQFHALMHEYGAIETTPEEMAQLAVDLRRAIGEACA